MNEKRWFILYLLLILLLSVLHSTMLMATVILLLLVVNQKARWKIFFRAFFALLLFNGTVTLSYLFYGLFVPIDPFALVLINLRALAITMLTFSLMHHVNFHKVLAFNDTMGVLYAFTYAQISLLRKMLTEYYQGLKSRGATARTVLEKKQLQSLLTTLFGTMLHKSGEQSLGLRSRGLLDD